MGRGSANWRLKSCAQAVTGLGSSETALHHGGRYSASTASVVGAGHAIGRKSHSAGHGAVAAGQCRRPQRAALARVARVSAKPLTRRVGEPRTSGSAPGATGASSQVVAPAGRGDGNVNQLTTSTRDTRPGIDR